MGWDRRDPQWITPGTGSNSRHGRAATEEELTALAPPENDADSSDAPSIQTLQDRYAAVTSAGVFEARLLRRLRRGDMRLQRDPQRVKIDAGAGEEGFQLNIG